MPNARLSRLNLIRVKSGPVTVLVGEAKEEFFVHEHLIRASSTFFDNALSKDWKEKHERTVRLPNIKVETFQIYVKWLYSGCFHAVKKDDATTDAQTGIILDRENNRWNFAYELGDFLQDNGFKDAMIDILIEKMIDKPDIFYLGLTETVYKYSGSDSPHRRFAVDTVVHLWGEDILGAKYLCRETNPKEYMNDLIAAMAKHLRDGTKQQPVDKFFRDKGHCEYHEHTQVNKPCYKTKYGFEF